MKAHLCKGILTRIAYGIRTRIFDVSKYFFFLYSVTFFLGILTYRIRLLSKYEYNCQHDHIPFNLTRNANQILCVQYIPYKILAQKLMKKLSKKALCERFSNKLYESFNQVWKNNSDQMYFNIFPTKFMLKS